MHNRIHLGAVARLPRHPRLIVGRYLLLVGGTTLFVFLSERTTIWGHGQGLSGVWLFLVTLPLSIPVVAVVPPEVGGFALFPLLGVIQAAAVYVALEFYYSRSR